jgi:hypothetical protein
MKTVSCWDHLSPWGIIMLTGEACSLSYRLLCDLTAQGKRTVERCLSVAISSESWNSGSRDDPHMASIMVTHEMLVPLAVFALLDAECRECWVIDGAVVGIEAAWRSACKAGPPRHAIWAHPWSRITAGGGGGKWLLYSGFSGFVG